MAVTDPSVDYNAKQLLRNRNVGAAPALPTLQVNASPDDYANAGVAPPSLPTQTVQATPQDYANAGVSPPTGGLSFLRGLANTMSAPTGIAGAGQSGSDPGSVALSQITAPKIAAAQAAAAAPAATPNPFANVQGSAMSTAVNPSNTPALASGVTRYDLGGDGPDSPNATRIYATRGQHGEDVFTDNANYAARVSTGGLRRGQTGTDAVYNNAQPGANNPNANYQYAPSTLEQQHGITPDQLGNLSPQAAQQALAYSSAAASANRGTDQGLSDQMDANLLRSRVIGGGGQGGYGGGATGPGGLNLNGLPATTQIAAMRAQQQAAYQQGRLGLQGQQLQIAKDADQRAQTTAEQQNAQSAYDQYEKIKQTDPVNAAALIANAIPRDADGFNKFAGTQSGRQWLNALQTDVLQPGAKGAYANDPLFAGSSTPGRAGLSTLADLETDPQTGQFAGVRAPGATDASDVIPAQRSVLRRVLGSLSGDAANGPEGLNQFNNFDQSLMNLDPATLQRLKAYGAKSRQPLNPSLTPAQ